MSRRCGLVAAEDTIRLLAVLGGEPHHPLGAAEWKRAAARGAWVRETAAAWREAHRRLNAAWGRIFAALPGDLSDEELEALNLPDPPEQAEVDALWAQLNDVVQNDRWPRKLYLGGI